MMSCRVISLRRAARIVPVLAMALCVAARINAEENWSRFRGPNGSGVAEGVSFPAKWSADDYAWKVPLPGKGHSSPIGWGDRLFVTAADDENGEVILVALDANKGETLWTRKFKSALHHLHTSNSYASSSPAADADRVYLTWATPDNLAIAALTHDGEPQWQRELGPVKYAHGYGGSPIVVDGLVVAANDNSGESFVAALDAETGEPRWKKSRAEGIESYATPAVWKSSDGAQQIIVNSTAEGMAGLALADGEILWQLPKAFPVRCVSSPVVAGELVFGGSGEGGNGKSFTAVDPAVVEEQKPKIAYELHKSLPQVPTPVAHGELLFVWSDRGVVSCHDVKTGKLHWSERVGGNFFGSPIIAGDKLYSIAASGEVVVLAADKKYELLGRTELGEASSSTPMVQAGKLFLRTETSLACLASEAKAE